MTDDVWKRGIEGRLAKLETRKEVDEVHRINVEKRLTGIENTLQWLVRLIFGAIILAAVGFALKGGFAI